MSGDRVVDRSVNVRLFWIMAVAGWGVMAFGVLGLLQNSARTHPDQWAKWFFGALLVHDALLAPLVFGMGSLVARVAPPPWRKPLAQALVASGIIVIVAFPFVRGYGRSSDNPSVLPNNYALGLAVTLAVVWFAVLAGHWLTRRKTTS